MNMTSSIGDSTCVLKLKINLHLKIVGNIWDNVHKSTKYNSFSLDNNYPKFRILIFCL